MKTVEVLLVDDDDIDATALKRAFRERNIANPIRRARDGMHALEVLRGQDEHESVNHPYLIILDLNMPRMSGQEFLEELRKDYRLQSSIVFVLTTSNDDRDKMQAYEKNIAGYLLKSNVGEDFENLIELLDHYWRYVEFPPSIK